MYLACQPLAVCNEQHLTCSHVPTRNPAVWVHLLLDRLHRLPPRAPPPSRSAGHTMQRAVRRREASGAGPGSSAVNHMELAAGLERERQSAAQSAAPRNGLGAEADTPAQADAREGLCRTSGAHARASTDHAGKAAGPAKAQNRTCRAPRQAHANGPAQQRHLSRSQRTPLVEPVRPTLSACAHARSRARSAPPLRAQACV